MSKRSIRFMPKMQTQKKEAILAVAWVTQQEGGFETPNVAASIAAALRHEGYHLSQKRVTDAMIWLDQRGYAARSVLGRRHRMFVMDGDVEVPEPGFVVAKRLRRNIEEGAALNAEAPTTNGAAPAAVAVAVEAPTSPRRRPPVPGRKPDGPARLDELVKIIRGWWLAQPVEAARWIDEVIEEFQQ